MTQQVTLHIDGQSIASLAVIRLIAEQKINQIPSATLTLKPLSDTCGGLNPALKNELKRCRPGAALSLLLDDKPVFSGTLVRQQLRLLGEQTTLVLEARHPLQKLVPVARSQLFQAKDDATIIRGLLTAAGLRVTLPPLKQLAVAHEQRVQFRCSDWQFLSSRLLATGCWLLPDAAGQSVTVQAFGQIGSRRHQIARQPDSPAQTLHEVDLSSDNRFTLDEVALQGWDIRQQKLSAPLKNRAAASAGGQGAAARRSWHQAFSCMPEPSVAALAQSWYDHHQLTALRGHLEVNGCADYHPGDGLTLSGFGDGLDGTHVITGVRHSRDISRGWRTQLSLGLLLPAGDSAPRIQELHIGVVGPFHQDQQKLDRIPILVPALGLQGKTLFARLGKPYASKQSGFCFYPEAGDEVIVGFFECDPGYPVILGAMHNPKNSAPFAPDAANQRKAIVLDPQDTQQQLDLSAAAATLSSDNIQLQSKTLGIKANESMNLDTKAATLKGSSSVVIQSSSIDLKK